MNSFELPNSCFAVTKLAIQGGESKINAINEYAEYVVEKSELKLVDIKFKVSTTASFAKAPEINATEVSHSVKPNG